ncbi:MAG: hypothetical protein KBA81_07525 [Rhabdochlamydiaceae bacterium]|jgi:uncharacterized membrane protein HdeD (DUF308 family)|nr:hypothetical protein [Rhabdochlamydiaceae bacterium]
MNALKKDPSYQAFRILQFTFAFAPILAGLDKFFYSLTNWSNYISPFVLQILQYHDRGFMMVVGVIEIIAGIGVIFRPKLFAYVVALWLFGIIINLLMTGNYFDIALRDLGLLLSAVALAKLSSKHAQ